MRRTRTAAIGAIVVIPAICGLILLSSSATPAGGASNASQSPTSTATIERKTLNAQTKVSGILGFDGSIQVSNGVATSSGADANQTAQALAQAQSAYDAAINERDVLHHPSTPQVASARAQIAQVRASLITARKSANGPTAEQVAQAQAQLAQAQAQVDSAQDATRGPSAAQVAQAQAQLAQAQAQLTSAQAAAAGPSPAAIAQAQAQVTQATTALAADQAALAAAQQALAACLSPSPTPDVSATPQPSSTPSCDPTALQLTVSGAQGRVTNDGAQLTAAQASLSDLSSSTNTAQAQANLTAARAAEASAQAALDALTSGVSPTQQSQLASAQAGLAAAKAALDALTGGDGAAATAGLAAATAQLRSAQAALDALLHPTAGQIRAADDAVAVARAQLATARTAMGAPRGIVTQLAAAGDIVQAGEPIYTLDGSHPVILLTGATPTWRPMAPGMSDGADVKELEQNLQDLGFASAGSALKVDDHWDEATTTAVKAWQHALGVAETGTIDLGQLVFEPGPLRVTSTAVDLGGTVAPGGSVVNGTTTNRIVSVDLDTVSQGTVKVGDPVDITLPDGVTTTTGTVTAVGSVATAGQDGANPTIPVTITLDDPSATGVVDQAPVLVAITTATATDVLAVPVQALVALLEGGYAVEVVSGATYSYVGVQLGLFANGWVEINGNGLDAGQTVVVPG